MSAETPRDRGRASPWFKLQLAGQSLRFRIDESALARLLAGETLSDYTRLDPATTSTRSLSLIAASVPAFQLADGHWRLGLPAAAVRDYVGRLPCREALVFTLEVSPEVSLEIRFEVDVRDSRRVGRRRAGS